MLVKNSWSVEISKLKNIIVNNIHHKSAFLLTIPLVLTAFTHIWNPIGFPDVFYDEGIYMRRAMHVLDGFGPQEVFEGEKPYYDHPYFGQIFLAGVFKVINYPNSLNSSSATDNVQHSIEMLYFIPRILMGILAIVDTFLIYKISERRYNNTNIAFIASVLFAVIPITWLTRRILLDSILLPFLLSSTLFAVYSSKNGNANTSNNNKKNILPILLSGIFLGLAIFTKIPAFAMIPLVGVLVYTNNNNNNNNKLKTYLLQLNYNKNLKTLGLWLIPVILIPLIWPAYSISIGQSNDWLGGVLYQGTERHTQGKTFLDAINIFFQIDPVLLLLGTAGFVFAAIKRDFFLLLWIIPYITFLYFIGYVQYFYWIPVLPAFSITAARLIVDLPNKISKKRLQKILPFVIISALGIFGLISTIILITTNVSSQFQAAVFVAKYLGNNNNRNKDITIVSSPVYSWIFSSIYNKAAYGFSDFRDLSFLPIKTEKILLISDQHLISDMKSSIQLQTVYDNTTTIATFKGQVVNFDNYKYPYTSMNLNYEGSKIEIRISK